MLLYTILMDILKISAVIIIIKVLLNHINSNHEYNSIDKKGVTFNIILSIIYMPLSLMGLFTIFFADAPTTNYSELKSFLLYTVILIGLSVPFLSIAAILTSVIARKKGKHKFSFIIQFLPIPFFIIMLILIFLFFKV